MLSNSDARAQQVNEMKANSRRLLSVRTLDN